MLTRPASVRTDTSNPFAHHTVSIRLPSIARDAARMNPDLPPESADALEALARELEADALIRRIDDPLWADAIAAHEGESWLHTDWFFAEIYFYRLLLDAVKWTETRRDPFVPNKISEIVGDPLRVSLFVAFEMTPAEPADILSDRLLRSMWGNRIDLSLKDVAQHGSYGTEDDLLVDHRAEALAHLQNHQDGIVHLIADNTGTELAMDWVLIDALLNGTDEAFAEQVILHVKAHPTFVSDATVEDALTLLAEIGGRGTLTRGFGSHAAAIAERLQNALLDGRLTIREDFFWNSASYLSDLPDSLRELFSKASLVIQKGDANYRRAIGDAIWDAATPFDAVTGYFPAPLLALRTLKSDPLAGLQPGQAEALDAVDPLWRVNGRRGVIQLGGQRR